MNQHHPPEITFGTGKSRVTLRGSQAIRAAGWTLRFLLIARALSILAFPLGSIYLMVKWWWGT
jgi:hypothetical protein